jgi:glycerol-3-phosphate acyltransferase PlsY
VDLPSLVRDALVVAVAYLVGSIPVGVIVARLTGGTDPRTIGSGRIGGTNALRALGPRRAAVVALGDVAKGFVPVLIAQAVVGDPLVTSLAGLAAIVGSMRSVFLGFGGGRGVSTGIGTMLAIAPIAVLLAAPIFFLVIARTRYVSAGSLLGSLSAAVITAVLWALPGYDLPLVYVAYAALGTALIWAAHRDNIQRLTSGTERKLELGSLVGRATPGGPGASAGPDASADDVTPDASGRQTTPDPNGSASRPGGPPPT